MSQYELGPRGSCRYINRPHLSWGTQYHLLLCCILIYFGVTDRHPSLEDELSSSTSQPIFNTGLERNRRRASVGYRSMNTKLILPAFPGSGIITSELPDGASRASEERMHAQYASGCKMPWTEISYSASWTPSQEAADRELEAFQCSRRVYKSASRAPYWREQQ